MATSLIRTVGVIGAGIAGLVAARSLQAAGAKVTIFDKARGPGGRSATRREGVHDFDHGAQFFTASDGMFLNLVEEWEDAGIVQQWDAPVAVLDRDGIAPAREDRLRFVGVPGMNAIAKHLVNGADLRVNTPIQRCDRIVRSWHLSDGSGGSQGVFDALIVATPPQQAIPFLEFAPQLAAAARRAIFSPCWAVMAGFDRPLNAPFDAAYVRDSPLVWVARNSSKPSRPEAESWVLHASAVWSTTNLDDDPDAVAGHLLRTFFARTGIPPVTPTILRAHRWRYALSVNPLPEGCLWDAEARVGVCGDWCSAARIEGAALSGLAVASACLGGAH